MTVAESSAESEDVKPAALPKDLLLTILGLLSSHERRVIVPLVCKAWQAAIFPSDSTQRLWEDVELRDFRGRSAPISPIQGRCSSDASRVSTAPSTAAQQAEAIRTWLSQRRNYLRKMTVLFPSVANEEDRCSPATSMACWARALGLALPALTTSTKLKQLDLHGPGVHATNRHDTVPRFASAPAPARSPDADAASAVLRGAFRLPSLEELHVYDIPWASSLVNALLCVDGSDASAPLFMPPRLPQLDLTNLRHLIISRSFYQVDEHDGHGPPRSGGGGSVGYMLDGGTAKAWAALGTMLHALPHLERLDLSYTHAMTYCDPARGVAAAPWPPLLSLRELSLAHDLSVQPPPPPPSGLSQAPAPAPSPQTPAGAPGGNVEQAQREDPAGANAGAGAGANAGAGASAGASAGTSAGAGAAPYRGVADDDASSDYDGNSSSDDGAAAAADSAALLTAGELEEALFGPPMLTVDATHALVELHSWLPRCGALASLDLSHCGLEAVPLAVAHLPALTRLNLYGNPLVSMRLPGPLRSLVWLRLSLDPCYDLVYDMVVAEGGDAAAADEEMWTVELPAPQLEELEVDSCSSRALGLIRQAAPGLPLLRRLVLVDRSAESLC